MFVLVGMVTLAGFSVVHVRYRRSLTNIHPNNDCTALVVYGTNLGSSVGLALSNAARSLMFLTPFVMEVLVGLLLGDGCITISTTGASPFFQFNQGVMHIDYIFYVFSILSHYCTHLPSYNHRKNDTDLLQLYTRSLPCFNYLFNLFYVNKIKVIPTIIGFLLTPVSLAFWSMDDGSKAGSGFYLNTHSFTYDEHLLLKDVLLTKFNLNVIFTGIKIIINYILEPILWLNFDR